jgi:hypothetical protein
MPLKKISKELQNQITFVYANETDLLNVALFGITVKEWRETNPDADGNIRISHYHITGSTL